MKFTSLLASQSFENWTVDGQLAAQVKNAGTFSYIRIYGAGHEVPAYKVCNVSCIVPCRRSDFNCNLKFGNLAYGQAALQMFEQIMSNQSLSST